MDEQYSIAMNYIPESPKNWEEDFFHENGQYTCNCCVCDNMFVGHKRRVVCKECADAESESVFQPELMTRWEFGSFVVYTFVHERHMYEFMDYRDWDSYGKSKLFVGDQKYEVKIMKENFKFGG
jgi:hypothetical protein